MLPGIEAPTLSGALLMLVAGVSWGVYSLRRRSAKEPTVATAGNFIRAVPLAVILFVALGGNEGASSIGVGYAAASGALASGVGYALWYAVLAAIPATMAATVQLSVPILAIVKTSFVSSAAVFMRYML